MWPLILDIPRDECKKILRRLELDAYASLVSALRAQGALNPEKRKLLQDIAATLNISLERHRAEIRRAVNDEKLATIAEHIAGPNTEKNWAIEGRRLVPLLPRAAPQTALTALANNVANIAAAENSKLPLPADTLRFKSPRVRKSELLKFKNVPEATAVSQKMANLSTTPDVTSAVATITSTTIPVCKNTTSASSPSSVTSLPNVVTMEVRSCEEEEISRKRRMSSSERTDASLFATQPPPPKISAIVLAPSEPHPQLLPQQQLQLQQQPYQHQQQPQHQQHKEQQQQQQQHPQQQQQHQHQQHPQQQQQHQQLQQQQQQQHPQLQQQQPQQQPQLPPPPPPPLPPPQQQQQQLLQPQQQQLLQPQQQLQQQSQQQPQQQQQQQQPQYQQQQQHQQQLKLHHQQYLQQCQQSPVHKQHLLLSQQQLQQEETPLQAAAIKTESIPPVKVSLTAATSRSSVNTVTTSASTSSPTTQKVIIMSSSGSPGSPCILQRSLSVPVVKTVSTPNSVIGSQRPTSVVFSSQPSCRGPTSPPGSSMVGNVVTICTNSNSANTLALPSGSSGVTGTTTTFIASNSGSKIRPKSVQVPARLRSRPGSIIIPMAPNQMCPTSNSNQIFNSGQSTQLKAPTLSGKQCVSIKTDCSGVKIVPISNMSSSAKILPKPVVSSSGQSPIYVMTSAASGSVATRTSSSTVSRMVTINTSPVALSESSSLEPSSPSASVMTKPLTKTNQATHVSTQNSIYTSKTVGNKPNIILVQKPSGSALTRGITVPTSGGKDISGKVVVGRSTGYQPSVNPLPKTSQVVQSGSQQLVNSSTHGSVIVLDLSQDQLNKSSTLGEILRASGILSDDSPNPEHVTNETIDEVVSSTHWIHVAAGDSQNLEELSQISGGDSDNDKSLKAATCLSDTYSLAEIKINKDVPSDSAVPIGRVGHKRTGVESVQTSASQTNWTKQIVKIVTPPQVANSSLQRIENETFQKAESNQDEELVEMVGELDPQTGIYSLHRSVKGNQGHSEKTVDKLDVSSPKANTKTMDIFRTALASADIDLETLSQDGGGKNTSSVYYQNANKEALFQSAIEGTVGHYPKPNNNNSIIAMDTITHQEGCTFIATSPSDQDNVLHDFLCQSGSTTVASAVFVEPTKIDTSEMHIEDFTSQKIQAHEVA